jgi:hypothetical protein
MIENYERSLKLDEIEADLSDVYERSLQEEPPPASVTISMNEEDKT